MRSSLLQSDRLQFLAQPLKDDDQRFLARRAVLAAAHDGICERPDHADSRHEQAGYQPTQELVDQQPDDARRGHAPTGQPVGIPAKLGLPQ